MKVASTSRYGCVSQSRGRLLISPLQMEGMEILSDDIGKLNGEMDTLRAQREADIRVIENMRLQLAEARVVSKRQVLTFEEIYLVLNVSILSVQVVVRSKLDVAAVARAMKVVADMRMSADPFLFEQMNDGQFDEVDNPVGDPTIGGKYSVLQSLLFINVLSTTA